MIEGTDVYDFFSCPYKVYNKHNRDRKLMLPFSEFSRHLMEVGREHEKMLVSELEVEQPKFAKADFEDGLKQTKKLMEKGTPIIYQAVLMEKDYLGMPDLLIKKEGKSKLGKYYYIPAEIKSSIHSKEQQVMQLKFYDMLLEKMQGKSSDDAVIILKTKSEMIDLGEYEDKFKSALKIIEKECKGFEFGMHIDAICKDCSWRDVCKKIAQEKQDVSLLYGLSRPNHYKLIDIGVNTLEDLKNAKEEDLLELEGVSENTIKKWKEQAEVFITKKDKINKVKLPDTKNHICIDIESTEQGAVYLIGLWHNNKFVHFFSENNEQKIIQDFVDYVLGLGSYTLYHYGSIEKTTFRRLFGKYNIPENVANEIYSNMIDLFSVARKNAILPISSYGLKEIAKHFGFKWRASDASGSNSMTWFDTWIREQNKEVLKKILDYNEDDVHATYVVLQQLTQE